MAYIEASLASADTPLCVMIRNKTVACHVVPVPLLQGLERVEDNGGQCPASAESESSHEPNRSLFFTRRVPFVRG